MDQDDTFFTVCDNYIPYIYKLCSQEYEQIIKKNGKIDSGHSLNHVQKVESLTRYTLVNYLDFKDSYTLKEYVDEKYGGDQSCLEVPDDVKVRVLIASLLHEVGDQKFADKDPISKGVLINEILERVLKRYPWDCEEMRQDIINMIDYCSASVWGDKIPDGSKVYQLIPRWADRSEATGFIGIVRTMTFAYKKRGNYPLVSEDDEFPTSMTELEQMAPPSRWEYYSSGQKKSTSGFSHYLDKIVHISGDDIPVPFMQNIVNEGQKIVKQFVIEFTTKFNKQFDVDYIISNLDKDEYSLEIKELEEMRQVMKAEGCKWIK